MPNLPSGSGQATLTQTTLGSTLITTDTLGDDVTAPASIPLNQGFQVLASRRVTGLTAGETILPQADVELTNDVIAAGSLQRFDVGTSVSVILAAGPTATSGVALTPTQAETLTWREHHHTFVLQAPFTVPAALAGGPAYINVVASASLAGGPASCVAPYTSAPTPCGVTFERSLDQLGILMAPPGGAQQRSVQAPGVANASLPSPMDTDPNYGQRSIVWASGPIQVNAGDVVSATASLNTSAVAMDAGMALPAATTTGCNAMFSGQFYLSTSSTSLSGSALPALDGDTGFNLTQAAQTATWTQLGFWRAPSSGYGVRYLVLVAWSARSSYCPNVPISVVAQGSAVAARVYGP